MQIEERLYALREFEKAPINEAILILAGIREECDNILARANDHNEGKVLLAQDILAILETGTIE